MCHRGDIGADIGATLIVKGRFYKPGERVPPDGERKLHLHIQGPSAEIVKKAKAELKRLQDAAWPRVLEQRQRLESSETGVPLAAAGSPAFKVL